MTYCEVICIYEGVFPRLGKRIIKFGHVPIPQISD